MQTVSIFVNGRLQCTRERPPFGCVWDAGPVLRGHHVRVVALLKSGERLVANVRTKDLGYAERVRAEAVLVPVIVTRGGKFVRGLKQRDFQVFEDGVAQPLASFVSEDAPLDLVLGVDISGSMEHALADVKLAVKQLLSKLRPGDAATIVGFNDTTFVVAERESDVRVREDAVDLLAPWGGTALYDATVRTLDLVSKEWGRKGVVIFSDGDDRHSLVSRDAALARVHASDAMLYTIGFGGGAVVPRLQAEPRDVRARDGRPVLLAEGPRVARRRLRRDPRGAGAPVRAVVLVHQHAAGRAVARHQGAGARREVRHPRTAGLPRGKRAAGAEVVMRTPNGIAVTAATLAVFGGGQPRAQQAPPDRPPMFRTQVDAVNVDVGVVDRQGRPMPGLAASDFTVTVDGRPRRVVTAEFVDVASARAEAARARTSSLVSSNEGAGVGRSVVFVVDENTLEPGRLRHVLGSASRLFDSLSYVDRSALVSLALGPNVEFTWAHDRVQEALLRAMGRSTFASSSEFASLSEARDIANRNPGALDSVVMRECGTRSAGISGGDSIAATGGSPGAPGSSGGSSTGPGAGGGESAAVRRAAAPGAAVEDRARAAVASAGSATRASGTCRCARRWPGAAPCRHR